MLQRVVPRMHKLYATVSDFEIIQFKSKEWMNGYKFHKTVGVVKGDASGK